MTFIAGFISGAVSAVAVILFGMWRIYTRANKQSEAAFKAKQEFWNEHLLARHMALAEIRREAAKLGYEMH